MADFKMGENIGNRRFHQSAKLDTGITDADIGKPLKLISADTYGLCADGDMIEGFLVALNPETAGGAPFGTVQLGGYKRVELDGAVAIGSLVEAAAPAAAGTAEANGLGKVSVHTISTVDVASLAASTFTVNWQLVSGTGLDGDTSAIIYKL